MRSYAIKRLFYTLDDGYRVGPRLQAYFQRHCPLSVQSNACALFLGSVFSPTDVLDSNGRAVDRRDNQVVEIPRIGHPPDGSQISFRCAGSDIASRNIRVLPDNRIANCIDGKLIGSKPVRIDPNIDRAF